jgi:general stress protein YciG
MSDKVKSKRGFAALSREQVAAISSKGGIAAHKAGTGHEFTSEEARRSGSLGGKASAKKRAEAKAAIEGVR